MALVIHRLPRVLERSGSARSTLYKQIAARLWTRPIRIGIRSVGWPSHEVDAILGARVAGKSDDEIRALVTALELSRQDAGGAT